MTTACPKAGKYMWVNRKRNYIFTKYNKNDIIRQCRHDGVQNMYTQTRVADVMLVVPGAVNGVGHDIVKCYRDSTGALQQYLSNRV